jgi:hypothetical protein
MNHFGQIGKIMTKLIMGLLLALLCVSCRQDDTQATNDPRRVLGRRSGMPIHSGILIIGNRYIKPPYVVSRDGLKIMINDIKVWEWPVWPLPDYSKLELPSIEEIKRNVFTLEQFSQSGYQWQIVKYYNQHYKSKEAANKIIEYYEKIPIIKKVILDVDVLKIYAKSGEERFICITPPHPDSYYSGKWTIDKVKKEVEEIRVIFEKNLKRGKTYLFIDKGEKVELNEKKSLLYLSVLLNIIESNMSLKNKLRLLDHIGVYIDEESTSEHSILNGLKNSKELRQHLQKRRLELNITPCTIRQLKEMVDKKDRENHEFDLKLMREKQELSKN